MGGAPGKAMAAKKTRRASVPTDKSRLCHDGDLAGADREEEEESAALAVVKRGQEQSVVDVGGLGRLSRRAENDLLAFLPRPRRSPSSIFLHRGKAAAAALTNSAMSATDASVKLTP